MGPLRALDVTQALVDTFKHYAKGSADMQADLDTPASAEFKKQLSTLQKDDFNPLSKDSCCMGNIPTGRMSQESRWPPTLRAGSW